MNDKLGFGIITKSIQSDEIAKWIKVCDLPVDVAIWKIINIGKIDIYYSNRPNQDLRTTFPVFARGYDVSAFPFSEIWCFVPKSELASNTAPIEIRVVWTKNKNYVPFVVNYGIVPDVKIIDPNKDRTVNIDSNNKLLANISGDTVISKISGETIIAKISGDTVISKISGETTIAKISGEPITVYAIPTSVGSGIFSFASGNAANTVKSLTFSQPAIQNKDALYVINTYHTALSSDITMIVNNLVTFPSGGTKKNELTRFNVGRNTSGVSILVQGLFMGQNGVEIIVSNNQAAIENISGEVQIMTLR